MRFATSRSPAKKSRRLRSPAIGRTFATPKFSRNLTPIFSGFDPRRPSIPEKISAVSYRRNSPFRAFLRLAFLRRSPRRFRAAVLEEEKDERRRRGDRREK